ncbi:MAG: ATP-binding cassette domain-containing protein, partial [Lachnospiraceae bacterium]|nr:ATP-binding cassette domain-containing protein [Lachnospiraceae bacterium]
MKDKNKVFLETVNLSKRFGETLAVDKVSLKINRGEIRGLIGENGSGKSTISSMISAIHTVTAGEMMVEGQPYRPKSPGDAKRNGISMIVQESGTIEALSVAENIFLGDEQRFSRRGMIDRVSMNREADRALMAIGVTDVDVTAMMGTYNFEMRKLIEVARAYYYEPKLFIVDETTTALSHSGREIIYELMEKLKGDGQAVLFISHDIPELMKTCDVLTILRDGKLVESIEAADFSEHRIKQAMVGREIKGDYYRSDYDPAHGERVMLEARGIFGEEVSAVDLTLHEGEILGLGGLSGCGMHRLGRMLFGLDHPSQGEVRAYDKHTGQLEPVTKVDRALKCG